MAAAEPDPDSVRSVAGLSVADATSLSGAADCFGFAKDADSSGWDSDELAPGTNLGGVTIVRLLAQGGMGRVYEARQDAPSRIVAVKVMRHGIVSAQRARRFEYEAQVLARLRHPNIAQIHTFGTHANPRGAVLFFVMELVEDALPITEFATARQLTVRERVSLFRKVCAAVAHGHQKGVIHRDLKPGNILVDGSGEPKVIDFGVARSLDGDKADGTALTRDGDVVGTLRYMSPEQLGVDGDVDARTDVYALGLVLHELVSGELPYDLRGRSMIDAVRILGDDSPVPTAAIDAAARADARMPRGDARSLSVIAAKCLEKRPANRYATGVELDAELGRWLDGEPILARPPTSVEAVLRLARRHRAASAAAIGILASLVAAVAGISVFYLRAEQQRGLAEKARATAERREAEAEAQAAEARAQLYISNVLLAAEARDRDNVAEAQRLLTSARELVSDAGTPRPVELDCLAASLDDAVRVFPGRSGIVSAVGWSPDGTWLASGATDGSIQVRSAAADDTPPVSCVGHGKTVWSLAFSPDGGLLASASADGGVRIWDARTGNAIRTLEGHDGAVYCVAFSSDGDELVTTGRDRTARVWDVGTWSERVVLTGHAGTVYSAGFSPDASTIATASLDATVRLWGRDGRLRATLHGHEARIFSLAFAPDGRSIATASEDATVRLWDVATGEQRAVMRHPFRVNAVAFIGDGGRIATASGDAVLRVWNAGRGEEVLRLRGHGGPLWSIACVPGTATVATGAADGAVRTWDVDQQAAPVLRGDDKVLAVAFSPDASLIATGQANSTVRLWDATTLRPVRALRKAVGRINAVRFTAAGTRIAGGCDDGAVRIWDVASGERLEWLRPHEKRIYSVDFSRDGGLMLTAAEDRTARVWDLRAARPVGDPIRHQRRVYCAVFSPDGRWIATACEDRIARLWTAGGELVREFASHEAPVNWLTFSADGRVLATASSDGAVRLWNVASGLMAGAMTGPARQIWKVALSADSTRVAAVSADGTVQVWDAATGRAAPVLRGHTDQVWAVAFAPDGRSLLTGSWDGTARLWGVSVGEIARRRAGIGSAEAE